MSTVSGGKALVAIMAVAIAAAVAAGLLAAGSPATARERRFDDRRVEDLTALGQAVDQHHSASGRLPDTLAELAQDWLDQRDPRTAQPYEYRVLNADTYHLCAVFQQPSAHGAGFWRHGSGRHCFNLHSRSRGREHDHADLTR